MAEFWLDMPSTLFSQNQWLTIVPNDTMSVAEKLNSIVRMSVYLGVLITILSGDKSYLYMPLIVMAITIFIYKSKTESMENFFDNYVNKRSETVGPPKVLERTYTYSTVDNPFANFDKIHDPKDKPPALPSHGDPAVKADIEKNFNARLFRDSGDLFHKENEQRQFYTMPVTTAMPDTTAFAKWCNMTDPTCKEDNRFCAPYFDPSEAV
jgi:hypothetical protein